MQGVRAVARALGACAGVLCAATAAWAQAECLGFEERTVVEGGTNGLTAVELADLDGDGDQDIVTAAFGDNRVVWYENDPTHPEGFRPHLVSDRLAGAADVHIRDIDGDGRPDLVASARTSNTVAWFENAGGTPPLFIARSVDVLARIALGVHAADVNGDGRVDLLATSYLDGKVFWYEQDAPPDPGDIASNPPPTFTRHEVTDDAPGAAAVFAVDLDEDSHTDVLVASRLDGTVAWYRNDLELDELEATPDFRRMVITDTLRGATAVIAADLDRDGRADVVAAGPEDGTVVWWRNGAGGTFQDQATLTTTQRMGVRSVKAADLDGDGDLDVLSASDRDDTIAWYENPCGTPVPAPCGTLGGFAEHIVSATALHANDAAAGELDASPGVDVVSVSSVGGFPASQDKLAWYRNVAAAPPDLPLETRIDRAADGAVATFAADLDGDLDVDVATAGRTNRITWFENGGGAAKAESPAFTEHVISTNALGAVDIDGGDLDCDGDVDLVSASADDDKIALYENDGAPDPTFVEQVLSIEADGARDVLVINLDDDEDDGDLLRDHDLDVLSASPSDGEIAWYENRCLVPGAACVPASACSERTFVRHVITQDNPEATPPVETGARSVHAVDMDGDHDLDVLAALATENRVRWYEQPDADPTVVPWTEHEVLSSSGGEFALTGATSVFGADIDDDGDADIVATAGAARLVLWLENDGNAPPAFTAHVLASDANDASSAYAFDLDSDHDEDILATVPGDGLIAWFENDGAQPPAFAINIVASGVDFAYSSTVANVNGDHPDDDPTIELYDVVAGERLEVSWFQASGEICQNFDLNGDEHIDGMELAWIGRAFGLTDPQPGVWWEKADLNRDGIIDGEDLAYLGSSGVFGFTTTDCSLICR